jgi:oligopeptide transport system ATP-binding protein
MGRGALVSVRDLKIHFALSGGATRQLLNLVPVMFKRQESRPDPAGAAAAAVVHAVDGVSFEIQRGETLALVGESGSGKSSVGRALVRLLRPTAGQVLFEGRDLAQLSGRELRAVRQRVQMIFQDPYASLNPRLTAGEIIAEPLRAFGLATGRALKARVRELLDAVGLPSSAAAKLPREFSGGQRQRIGIARALAVEPELIVADEPLAALDVSIQAQILNLLARLKAERGLTFLFISHDLRAVRHIAERVAVMYLGRLAEVGPTEEVFRRPLAPYTRALLEAVPLADPRAERARRRALTERASQAAHSPAGDAPSVDAVKAQPAVNPPPVIRDPQSGCRFHPRCPYAIAECRQVVPEVEEIAPNHWAACIRISRERPDITHARPGMEPGLTAGRVARGAPLSNFKAEI